MKIRFITIAALALALVPSLASAQTSTAATTKKPSLMQRLMMKKKAMQPAASSGHKPSMVPMHPSPKMSHSIYKPAVTGEFIGNKTTKVFHLPGDKELPAEKNRVYFKNAAAAEAAGYHQAGMGGHKRALTHKVTKRPEGAPNTAHPSNSGM